VVVMLTADSLSEADRLAQRGFAERLRGAGIRRSEAVGDFAGSGDRAGCRDG